MPFNHQCENCGNKFITSRRASRFCCCKCSVHFNSLVTLTDSQEAELKRLRNVENWGLTRIGAKLGISKSSVRGVLYRLGIFTKGERKPSCNTKYDGSRGKVRPWNRPKLIARLLCNAFSQEQQQIRKEDECHHWGNHPEVFLWRAQRNQVKYRTLKTNYYFSRLIRSRICNVLQGRRKSAGTFELLGCSMEFFKKYIERHFKRGMNWNNYGVYGWHFDHVEPCNSFDLSKPEEQRKCFHFSNLKPIWCDENWKKRNKIVPVQRELILDLRGRGSRKSPLGGKKRQG